jgi:hypothetical protein
MVSCTGSSPRITGGDAFSDTRVDTGTDPVPEAPCFAVCADAYFTGASACIHARRDCLEGCGGFEDVDCLTGCEDMYQACEDGGDAEMDRCIGRCPCWPGFTACVDGCAASSLDCPEACERPGTGYDEWVECTTGCEIGFTACMSGCF